jgi:four helix bundle protein
MGQINSFRDLNVYKTARAQSRMIFKITQTFPSEERFSLTDQIRRSSRAVNAMIAEAWARRPYVASFSHKINEALGEAMETQAWLDHCLDCDYITAAQHRQFDSAWQSIGAMLYRMMERAESFCQKTPR